MSKQALIGFFFALIAAVVGIVIWSCKDPSQIQNESLVKVNIATMPYSFTGYSIFLASEKGYFKEQGLDVTLKASYPHGKAALNAVVTGETELGVSSETPFMHTVLNGGKIIVFAIMITAEHHLAIVARKDRGVFKAKDLKNKTIGVTLGSNGEYFMDTVLLLNGIPREKVKTVHLQPKQMFDAIINGDVDAIATWNPQMYKARKELGEQGSTFSAEGLYSPYFIISARQDYVHAKPEIIEKIIRSLIKASNYIQKFPDESRKIVAKHLKTEESLLKEISATYRFKILLDQSFLMTLENQSKWAIKKKLTDQTKLPNYYNFIYLDALSAVKPENVRIIR
ncbi:MAG: ABC transporter substrate-binding protein [Candidatus Desulfatibia sp.]|uniref:ABC transporter substrate-binding protein n=1 Tax=Candidatus Desulfatibia sp. TaxID=3101189 RepID=UPI002F33133C